MPLPPFATVADLDARRPQGVSDRETARAWAALVDASALIRTEIGKDWVDTAGKLAGDLPEILVSVTCSAARRALDNPDGVQSESLGAYSVSLANSSSDVYLTKAEQRLVRKASGVTGLGVITTTRDPENLGTETASVIPCGPGGDEFLPVDPPGDPIVWGSQLAQY